MNLLLVLVVVSTVSMSLAIPLDMAKEKKGEEKPMVLHTDRTSHLEKRAKEVLMFGNQQNSPRIKKSDPEKELLSTSDKSASSEGPTEVVLPEKPSPESEADRSSELLNVAKLIENGDIAAPHDSDSDTDSDSDLEGENKSGSSDIEVEEPQEVDKSKLLALQSIPVSLAVDDGDKALAELNKVSLGKQTPLLINQAEGEPGKELPELGEQLETEKPADYSELLREYENENAADLQRQQALQSSPFLNYIYRRRREMEDRVQRTKRELLLPEEAEQYLKGEIPEKLVSLESWPNAYSQSELLEKEAPYQIVNEPLDNNAGYGYQNAGYGYAKRSSDSEGAVEEETTDEDDEEDVPYQEVVLDGRPGYFIPAKRDFFPYSEEPVSHYSALVDKREDEADYARLLQLARALAVTHDGQE